MNSLNSQPEEIMEPGVSPTQPSESLINEDEQEVAMSEATTDLDEEIDIIAPSDTLPQSEGEADINIPATENNEIFEATPQTSASELPLTSSIVNGEVIDGSTQFLDSEASIINKEAPAINRVEENITSLSIQQELRDNVKNENFFEAFFSVIKNAFQLKITTIVEDENESSIGDKFEPITGQPGKRIITAIELLDGDIKNIYGSRFLENEDYKELLKFHMDQVNKGQDIIKNNLDYLHKLVNYLIQIYKEDQKIKSENTEEQTTPEV